jgi:phosphoesterase RecJ-like protein
VKIAGEESLTDEQRKGFFASQSSLEVSSYKDENIFKEALGIVLDCNNEKRVFTGAQQFCKETIKIDHHPDIEDFTTYKYVDDKSAAATQIIGKMIKENYPDKIEDNIAKFLYLGILTDTNRFYYPSTSQETFDIGSWLYTNIKNKQEIYEAIYYNSVDHLKIQNKLFRYIR